MTAAHAMLDDLVGKLGYRDSRGYVDDSIEPGARGMVWSDLQEKCGVTAAFFKGAVPVVAFVAGDTRDDAMHAHRRLWNYGRVPILIATTSHEVMALSCNTAQAPGRPDAALLAEAHQGQEITTVFADFTRFSVESGRLASRRSKQLGTQNRVDNLLLRNLRAVRSRLLSAGVHEDEIEPLLGRSIFVRYLEDRRILEPYDLRELEQPESLEAALTEGWDAVSALFAVMSDYFNGDVFRRDVLTRRLPDDALRVLSDFFHGADPETGQVPCGATTSRSSHPNSSAQSTSSSSHPSRRAMPRTTPHGAWWISSSTSCFRRSPDLSHRRCWTLRAVPESS